MRLLLDRSGDPLQLPENRSTRYHRTQEARSDGTTADCWHRLCGPFMTQQDHAIKESHPFSTANGCDTNLKDPGPELPTTGYAVQFLELFPPNILFVSSQKVSDVRKSPVVSTEGGNGQIIPT
eukprot:m.253002 g.253002  ORF g.253002 m.253002 type:complete len:123 (+) comp15926_c0_seq3:829-1197(+)